ncbi:MAG: caspase family protein [Flavobacteriales bacterium]|nr:caspase family protein [Flavobacteriales bacterium]
MMKVMLAFGLLLLFIPTTYGQEEQKRCTSWSCAMEDPASVTILDLSMKNLKELSPEIGLFVNLKRLDLTKNRITSLPPEIGNLKHLEALDISFNKIQSLPPEIGKCTNLREINASFNQITFLPREIGNLTHLEALNLSFNRITALPPEIGKLSKLKVLTVKLNPLNTVPVEMAEMKVLTQTCKKGIYMCVKRNNPSFAREAKDKYFYQYRTEPGNYSYYSKTKAKEKHDGHSAHAKKKPDLDLSFFSTAELKDMYRDAFTKKDYENVSYIQEELAKRTVESSEVGDDNPAYRGSGDPLKGLNISKSVAPIEVGKYFALIIGIDDYSGAWKPLNNAVNDAKAVEQLLRSEYIFDNFQTLYNADASGRNIIKALEWLVANVSEKDNVFIYYSGHGEYRKELNKGYWVPADVTDKSTYGFISNSDIQTFLGGIKSNHTLLATDACFSGDIFRGETFSVPFEDNEKYYKKVHALVSRQAITSGGIEPVVDGGRDGHSVFTYYFLKVLRNNTSKYYDASQLFNDIKIPVVNNTDQSPQFQSIKNTGDEGGQFLFIKK